MIWLAGLACTAPPDCTDGPWHADLDGDGFGAPEASETCGDTDVLDATDCDDDEPTVHPGAWEVPADGVDADCDGADAPMRVAFADRDDGLVWTIDRGPPTSLARTVAVDQGPLADLAWDGGDRLYAASPDRGTVAEIDLGTGASGLLAAGLWFPSGLAWDAGRLVVGITGEDTVAALDPTDGTRTDLATVPGAAGIAAVDGAVYAGSASEPALYRVDGTDAIVVAELPWPPTLVVPAEAGRLWVASGPDRAIALVDPAAGTHAVVSRGLLGPAHGCVDPAFPGRLVVGEVDGSRLLSVAHDGAVEVLAVSVANPTGCAGIAADGLP